MNALSIRPQVARLFATAAHRSTRLGVEQELISCDASTGEPVPIELLRSATRHGSYAPWVAFEPGGQLELSLPPVESVEGLRRQLEEAQRAARADCLRYGVHLHALPVDPRGADGVPLQLRSPRYLAMQAHFDTIGPAGRQMMRATAATQLCLDWWPGQAGLEQWRVLNLAAPFLAAAFARTVGPAGRLSTWLAVDPSRTACDDRLLRGDDPVAAYADLAASAVVFTHGGIAEHLTTLFPPVRPRGHYLEVRFLDVLEPDGVARAARTLTRLLYDDQHRRHCLRRLESEQPDLAAHWIASAAGEPEVVAIGRELAVPAEVAA